MYREQWVQQAVCSLKQLPGYLTTSLINTKELSNAKLSRRLDPSELSPSYRTRSKTHTKSKNLFGNVKINQQTKIEEDLYFLRIVFFGSLGVGRSLVHPIWWSGCVVTSVDYNSYTMTGKKKTSRRGRGRGGQEKGGREKEGLWEFQAQISRNFLLQLIAF